MKSQVTEFEQVLMQRDKMTREEAYSAKRELCEVINASLESGDFDEIEDYLLSQWGLEPDYMFEFLGC